MKAGIEYVDLLQKLSNLPRKIDHIK